MTNPTQEMVDIVDAKDNVVGTVSREEAREKGLCHRLIAIAVENGDGDLLVQWRSRHKKAAPRVFSLSVVGTVAAGESYEEAAKRELLEELGILGGQLENLGLVKGMEEGTRNVTLFALRYDGEVSGWEEEAEILDMWSPEELDFMRHRFPYLLGSSFEDALMKKYLKWRSKR